MTEDERKRPHPGAYYAISIRYLGAVEWARDLEPVDRIGYTIFIYKINDEKHDSGS